MKTGKARNALAAPPVEKPVEKPKKHSDSKKSKKQAASVQEEQEEVQQDDLPPGWVRVASKTKPGAFYYAHPATNQTQADHPGGKASRSDSANDQRNRDNDKEDREDEEERQRKAKEERAKSLMKESEQRAEEKKRKRQEQKQAEEREAEEAMRKAMERRARERASRETQMKEMETEGGKTKKEKKEKKRRKVSSSSSDPEEVTEAELKKWREEEDAREREVMEAERRKQQEEDNKRRSHDDEQKRKKEKLAAEVALKAAETARKAAEMEEMKRREKEEEQKRRIEAKRIEGELKRLNEEKKREEELEAFRKMTESAKEKKKEEEKKKELLTNDGNFMAKFLAMQKEQKTTKKEFNVNGKWVMTDKKSGDKFKYNFTQLAQGSFGGEQRGAGKITKGIIDDDQISWQVANIKCTGRLESSSKLVDGSYFDTSSGEKLGSFSGELQGESERPKDDDHRRSRGEEEDRRRRREEDDDRRRKEEAEKRRREEDQRRLLKEEDERKRRREEDDRRRRQQEEDEEQDRRRRRREEEEASSRRRRREEEEERRRREEASRSRRQDYNPDEGIRKDYDPDAKEHDAKRARLSELLEETANPAPFTKAMGSPPAFPPVPPKVMGNPGFPPAPPRHPDPVYSANLASAPPVVVPPTTPKPVATGMVIWYNGRQLRGVILADQDGKLLQIAPNGAPNVGSAPPIPEGLMHGTRVTYSTIVLPGIGLACSDVRPMEGQVGLSCGGDSQLGGREVNEDRTVALDLPDGFGHLVGVIDGHRGVRCSDFLAQKLPQAVVNSVRQSFGQFVMSGRSINSLTTAEEVEVIRTGLIKAFEASDRDFLQAAKVQHWGDGACAMLVLLAHGFQSSPGQAVAGTVPNAPGGVAKCFVAWCGTTRMLLLRGRSHVTCTRDHVCSDPEELKRLQTLGALLVKDPNGRTFMGRKDQMEAARQIQQGLAETTGPKTFLASSRGLGDIQLKEAPQSFFGERKPPILTATPEVSVLDLTHEDWGIVLVGRGVCSVLADQDIADICLQEMGTMRKGPIETAKVVTARATKKGAKDNVTCIAMRLGWAKAPMQMSLAELLAAGKAAPPPPPPSAPAQPPPPQTARPAVPAPRLQWHPDAPARPPPPAPVIIPAKAAAASPLSKGQGSAMLAKAAGQAFPPPPPIETTSTDTVHSGPISPGWKAKWNSSSQDAATSAEEWADDDPAPEVTPEPIDPNKRYTGKLKFWNPKIKSGGVSLDSSFALEGVPSRTLAIEELQVKSGGKRPPKLEKGLEVEFNIAQEEEGPPWCVEVTLPGGVPITQANMERRKLASEEFFIGTVDSYNSWGFGYVAPNTPEDLPPMARAAMQNELKEFTKKRKNTPQVLTLYFRKQDVKGRADSIAKGASVKFQVYMDEKGAGACNISLQE